MATQVDELFDIDEATLERMPEWFRLLRDAYLREKGLKRRA